MDLQREGVSSMARIRSIKPDFFLDEELAVLSPMARLFFIGLWTQADKEGLLEYRPARLKASIFPYHDADVPALMDELEAGQFVQRYEAEEKVCVSIRNFAKHQRPHPKETAFGLPPPSTGVSPPSAKRWVYFVRAESGGPVKIGTAANVEHRLASLQTGAPERLCVLGVMESRARLESELHKRFDALRLHGEWFRPEPELLSFIAEKAIAVDVHGRPWTSPDASRRVLLVVGDGDGDGCGNGLPEEAGQLPLTAYADSHDTLPPESFAPCEVERATDTAGLLPHEPPPASEPPLMDLLAADYRELRGGEYREDRADPAAMRDLLTRGRPPEIRRRWRIGIAVPPGKYGRVSKLSDLVRLWNECDAAPATSPPGRHRGRSLNPADYREGDVDTL
ncbi:replication initiation protein [Myxococcus phage Mx8]|uniref:p19 n=1 Tax=Myxococcus phage Mx8 TaxID=49964 RepID=Q94MV0_9CAUD|nr:replication initiation protein [Myxococcus phage Mx8]AAK94354.1 p19 [Myxococcus phage Mx8]